MSDKPYIDEDGNLHMPATGNNAKVNPEWTTVTEEDQKTPKDVIRGNISAQLQRDFETVRKRAEDIEAEILQRDYALTPEEITVVHSGGVLTDAEHQDLAKSVGPEVTVTSWSTSWDLYWVPVGAVLHVVVNGKILESKRRAVSGWEDVPVLDVSDLDQPNVVETPDDS